jgi:hypothetical protein
MWGKSAMSAKGHETFFIFEGFADEPLEPESDPEPEPEPDPEPEPELEPELDAPVDPSEPLAPPPL